MEKELKGWEKAGWKIELILFDGLTPLSKFVEINSRQRSRIRDGHNSASLSLAASAACVCQATIEQKFPHVNCRVAPAECDDILASIAYQYALKNPATPTYLFTGDSDFCAFDFPSNVVLVDPFAVKKQFDTLKLTEKVKNKFNVPPSALAHEVRQLQPVVRPNVLTLPAYKKFAKDRQAVLDRYKIASFSDYCASDEMMNSYNVLSPHTQEPSAHRIVNSWTDSKSLYMYMPILCEPKESEYCYDAGRRWRSVAYEIISQKAGANEKLFVEYGRNGEQAEGRNIPITDEARQETKEAYKYYSISSVTNEINKWTTPEHMIEAMIKEVAKTTQIGRKFTNLNYNMATTENLARKYLTEIFQNSGNPNRVEIIESQRGFNMSVSSRRWYNKFLACVNSFRLLEAAGFTLPVSLELSDMDGARWAQMIKQQFEIKVDANKTDKENRAAERKIAKNREKAREMRALKAQHKLQREAEEQVRKEEKAKLQTEPDLFGGIPTGLGPRPTKKTPEEIAREEKMVTKRAKELQKKMAQQEKMEKGEKEALKIARKRRQKTKKTIAKREAVDSMINKMEQMKLD